jgi:hypothetical protein
MAGELTERTWRLRERGKSTRQHVSSQLGVSFVLAVLQPPGHRHAVVLFLGRSPKMVAASLPRENGGVHKKKGNEEKRGRQRRREEIVCNLD